MNYRKLFNRMTAVMLTTSLLSGCGSTVNNNENDTTVDDTIVDENSNAADDTGAEDSAEALTGIYDQTPSQEDIDAFYEEIFQKEDVETQEDNSYVYSPEDSLIDVAKEGNSDAFSVELQQGITVSAKENQLDRNRDFNFTDMTEDKAEELTDELNDLLDSQGYVFAAWDIDAGLKDNERFPGSYEVAIDLSSLDIAPELYDCVQWYRVSEDGTWVQYSAARENDVISYNSRQNSMIVGAIVVGVGGYIVYQTSKNWSKEVQEVNQSGVSFAGYNKIPVYGTDSSGKYRQVYSVEYIPDEAEQVIRDKIKEMYTSVKKGPGVRKKMRDVINSEKENNLPLTQKQREEIREEYTQEYLANNKAYQKLNEKLEKMINDKTQKHQAEKIAERAAKVYEFYSNNVFNDGRFKEPTGIVSIKLTPNLPDATSGVAINRVEGNAFIALNMRKFFNGTDEEYDNAMLSIAHEMFHVCQRGYLSTESACMRWDEAVAALLEKRFYEYYQKQMHVKWESTDTASSSKQMDYFQYPLDKEEGTLDGSSYSLNSGENSACAGYPLFEFIDFVWQNHAADTSSAKTNSITWSNFLDCYSNTSDRSFYGLMCSAFAPCNLTDLEFTIDWKLFVEENANLFAKSSGKNNEPVMELREGDGSKAVTIPNTKYSVRIRTFEKSVSEDYSEKVKVLIAFDDGIDVLEDDMFMMPVGDTKLITTSKGFVLESGNVNIEEDGLVKRKLYLIEADGGEYRLTNEIKYKTWLLESPKVEKPVLRAAEGDGGEEKAASDSDRLVEIKLPELSVAAKDGQILGYAAVFTRSDGTKFSSPLYKTAQAGETVTIPFEKFCLKGGSKEDVVSGSMQMYEIVERQGGKKKTIFGPPSEKIKYEFNPNNSQQEEKEEIFGHGEDIEKYLADDRFTVEVYGMEGYSLYEEDTIVNEIFYYVTLNDEDSNIFTSKDVLEKHADIKFEIPSSYTGYFTEGRKCSRNKVNETNGVLEDNIHSEYDLPRYSYKWDDEYKYGHMIDHVYELGTIHSQYDLTLGSIKFCKEIGNDALTFDEAVAEEREKQKNYCEVNNLELSEEDIGDAVVFVRSGTNSTTSNGERKVFGQSYTETTGWVEYEVYTEKSEGYKREYIIYRKVAPAVYCVMDFRYSTYDHYYTGEYHPIQKYIDLHEEYLRGVDYVENTVIPALLESKPTVENERYEHLEYYSEEN